MVEDGVVGAYGCHGCFAERIDYHNGNLSGHGSAMLSPCPQDLVCSLLSPRSSPAFGMTLGWQDIQTNSDSLLNLLKPRTQLFGVLWHYQQVQNLVNDQP